MPERLNRPEGYSAKRASLSTPDRAEKLRSHSVESRAGESTERNEGAKDREGLVKSDRLLHLFDDPEAPEVEIETNVQTQEPEESESKVSEGKEPEESESNVSEEKEASESSRGVKLDTEIPDNKVEDVAGSINRDVADTESSGTQIAKVDSLKERHDKSIKEESPKTETSGEKLVKEEVRVEPSDAKRDEAELSFEIQSKDNHANQVNESLTEIQKESKDPTGSPQQKSDDSLVVANIDTSMLSPVGSPISDANVMRELHLIAETEHQGVENDGDISEAETVIAEGREDLKKVGSLLRKDKDAARRKLKRKVLYSSDEEADVDVSVATKSPESSKSDKVDNKVYSPQVETHSTNDDDLNDSEASSGDRDDRDKNNKLSRKKKDYKIKRDSTGRSLLQRACKKGDLQEVKNLIEKGADANESDFGGFTCLHEAALAGHNDVVEYLIEQGANVNKQALKFGDYETPLMDAAENKHVETVKTLLKHGADPDIVNADGYSALTKLYHLQDEEEDYEEIIELLDAASQIGGISSLQAVSQSPRKIIEDPTETYFSDLVRKKSSATIFKYLAQGLKESAAGDFVTHGYTLQKHPDILNVVARNGHVELVDILLGLNPGSFDINQKNRIGVTVLLASVGRGNYDVVKFLLSKGADPAIKRDEDGLNALQVAKHSAQHDPREVVLLEQYLSGHVPKDSKTPQPRETGGDGDEMDVDKPVPAPTDKKRKLSEDRGGSLKKAKSKEPESKTKDRTNTQEAAHKSKEVSFRIIATKEAEGSIQSHVESHKDEPQGVHEASREGSPHYDHELKRQKLKSSASASPVPLTKAQEEHKIKAVEEAKHWQEKVQAKKKARKEMFLLAEKEKEKKRKEVEEKKMEELKQQKEKEVEEKLKEAEEAKRLMQEMEKKRSAMEIQSIISKYPIGLQEASFDGSISDKERLKFSPLYVFEHEEESWVIDLQVALLLAAPVSEIHKHCNIANSSLISLAAKEALWPLFFHMVGVGKHDRVDKQGCAKFKTLEMRYLKLSEVAHFVRELYPEVDSLIWKNGKLTRVKLDIQPKATKSSASPLVTENSGAPSFVPPKWRQRMDVLRTVRTANMPLW